MDSMNRSGYILLPPYKSLAAAIVLNLFFGFFGMIYASWWFALVYLFFALIISTIPQMGILLFALCWVSCPFIAARLVMRHNKKLQALYLGEK